MEVIENTLRNQIKVESGTSWGAGGATSPPAECFGIKYSFNYLRERFIALRKVRREKTGSDRRVHEKCFSLETYNGYECRESFFESLSYGNLFWVRL